MVDEIKAFNLLSEMIIEIRELRNSVTKLTMQNRHLQSELDDLNKKMTKRITLPWMNLIRKRLIELNLDMTSKEYKFIEPIFLNGLQQESYINDHCKGVRY